MIVPPGLKRARRFGRVDHLGRDAVLDAAARIHELELGRDGGRCRRDDVVQPDQGSAADEVDHVVRDAHAAILAASSAHQDRRGFMDVDDGGRAGRDERFAEIGPPAAVDGEPDAVGGVDAGLHSAGCQ